MDAGALVRSTRERHGLSQRRLALRAGTGQAAISRIERGQVSPSIETTRQLMAAMGEELDLGGTPFERHYDPVHLRALRERPAAERLELSIAWNRLAQRLAQAGARSDSDA